MIKEPVFYKNPSMSAVLSALWVGVGQIYNGEIAKGIALAFVYGASIALVFINLWFLLATLAIWTWGIFDSYTSAAIVNNILSRKVRSYDEAGHADRDSYFSKPSSLDDITLDDETKKCPTCAEKIKLEAIKCRFCGEMFNPDKVDEEINERKLQILGHSDKKNNISKVHELESVSSEIIDNAFICSDCGNAISKNNIDKNAELFCPLCSGRLVDS